MHVGGEGWGDAGRRLQARIGESIDRCFETGPVRFGSFFLGDLGERSLEDDHAFGAHEFFVDACGDFDLGIVGPREVGGIEGLDPVRPLAFTIGAEAALPVVEARIRARHRGANRVALGIRHEELHAHLVVALAKARGMNADALAHDRFDGETTAVDVR